MRRRLEEHPADDEALATDSIGEPAGHQLAEPPDRRIDRGQRADLGDAQTRRGVVDRQQPPGEAVVEVVHEPGLAGGGERRLAEAREREHPARREPAREVLAAGMGGRLVAGVAAGLADEDRRQAQAEARVGEPEQERRRTKPPALGDEPGREAPSAPARRSRPPR